MLTRTLNLAVIKMAALIKEQQGKPMVVLKVPLAVLNRAVTKIAALIKEQQGKPAVVLKVPLAVLN